MGAINLLLILMGCTEKSEENTESSGEDQEGEQPLDTLLVVSTVFSAILFGYKGNKVLGFGRVEREAKAAEFEISQIEKKVTAMLEVWEGGGLEEENRPVGALHPGQHDASARAGRRALARCLCFCGSAPGRDERGDGPWEERQALQRRGGRARPPRAAPTKPPPRAPCPPPAARSFPLPRGPGTSAPPRLLLSETGRHS